MLIKKRSMLSGVEREMDLNVTEEQIRLWQSGTLIQVAMPQLSIEEREFMMTGITKEEWDNIMGPVDDDDHA